jgi:trehalose/maltose transport system substrate-binding protein
MKAAASPKKLWEDHMTGNQLLLATTAFFLTAGAAGADTISFATGGVDEFTERMIAIFEERTGHDVVLTPMPASSSDQFAQYRVWFAQQSTDVDVIMSDVIWAPQLAEHLLDLTDAAKDVIGNHFPSVVQSQTVDGRLVAIPSFTAAPALYYRTDLLEKYSLNVPTTWADLTNAAQVIQDGERAAGNADFWGFVWQGAAYEGLTCNALEWVASFGGGEIVEADGSISINNERAAAALDLAASWVGTISPDGVLSYMEEDARGVWQTGNAAFLRNWPYAYGLGNGADSPISGKFEAAPLPAGPDGASAATLGGWNAAVSRYSLVPDAATEFALFLGSEEYQLAHALAKAEMPTIVSLYENPEIIAQQPLLPRWLPVLSNSVARPSAPTKSQYNEVSARFWTAAHNTLTGTGTGAENLEILEAELEELRGEGW